MCGIAGFTGYENNEELAKMANNLQVHRGPDNQQFWSDDFISFAHQRLSIIDLSDAANQPFHKGDYLIVFNGEIYNYKSLAEQLKDSKGTTFKTSSDTEVVLEMFINYGAASLELLIGMFAFAIYNKKSGELFIARDHFGIKPLFYTTTGGGFAFSSELKTLIRMPGFDKQINMKALVSSINYLWVSGNETMFTDAHKLPPAHYLIYSPVEGPKIKRYWRLEGKVEKEWGLDESSLTERVASTLEAAVDRHMVADVPVSSFLSGGLDSSLISVIAKKTAPDISTFTIGTTSEDKKVEQMPDDEKYARTIAEEFKLKNQVIRISPDIIKDLPDMVKTLDEPIADPAAINTYLICREARRQGVKVILSGMGADEIYFGYRRQKATLMAMKYRKLPGIIKKTVSFLIGLLPSRLGKRGLKTVRWAKRFLSFADLPVGEAYMRSYSYYSRAELLEMLSDSYHPAVEDIYQEHARIFSELYPDDLVNRICNTDIQMFMLGLNLTYTDRASMAASVEVRVPFIDRLVIEEAMAIPGTKKYHDRISKYILKKAAEKHLPNEIVHRPKASFGAPLRSWISGDLRPMVDDLLSEESVNRRGFFNYNFVRNMIEEERRGMNDYAYQLYQLLTLELWCREYLDN